MKKNRIVILSFFAVEYNRAVSHGTRGGFDKTASKPIK
jgi:hypothetical protein